MEVGFPTGSVGRPSDVPAIPLFNQKSKSEVILVSERNSEMSDILKTLLWLSPLCPDWIPWSLAISSYAAVNWTLEWNSTHLCSHCSVGISLLHHPYLSMLAVLASLGLLSLGILSNEFKVCSGSYLGSALCYGLGIFSSWWSVTVEKSHLSVSPESSSFVAWLS